MFSGHCCRSDIVEHRPRCSECIVLVSERCHIVLLISSHIFLEDSSRYLLVSHIEVRRVCRVREKFTRISKNSFMFAEEVPDIFS